MASVLPAQRPERPWISLTPAQGEAIMAAADRIDVEQRMAFLDRVAAHLRLLALPNPTDDEICAVIQRARVSKE